MTHHQLQRIESGWHCSICKQQWKNKPSTLCPGVPVYNWQNRPPNTASIAQLKICNKKPTGEPVGVIGSGKSNWVYLYDYANINLLNPDLPKTYTWNNRPKELKTPNQLQGFNLAPGKAKPKGQCPSRSGWIYLYDPSDEGFEIFDSTLPHCYRSKNDVPPELKSERDLKSINLIPGDAEPKGCYRYWDREEEVWTTVLFYDPADCQWEVSDQYLCKTTLKQTYLLSNRWIKQIGTPDSIRENPHHRKFAPMHLYSRQRVEAFLAEHAEEYAHWLTERDRYVAIFEQNKEVIQAGQSRAKEAKLRMREQMARCLECASGCATPQGFLCAIFPLGLEAHQIPCVEWSKR